jgi:hypothetical protein
MKRDLTINQLDPSQKHALRQLIAAADDDEIDLSLVFGPPGTGKSQLLVSLLYELAIRKKKVLFVSQNTEALDVIARMLARVEKDMGLPDNHLSLSDFCLKLHAREQRYLKYITAQASRLNSKLIPPLDMLDEADDTATAIPLGYVHLDRTANYATISEDLGVDELLRYFMQYVHKDLVIETLYEFGSVTVRAVLRQIDAYPLKDDFSFYNQPQNELRFISTTNTEVNLNDVQSGVRDIEQAVTKLTPGLPPVRKEMRIDDYVGTIVTYAEIAQYFNLYRIKTDRPDIAELEGTLRLAAIKNNALLPEQEVIQGLEVIKRPIFQDAGQIVFLNPEKITDYSQNLQELNKLAEQFHKFDQDLVTFDIRELLFNLISKVDVDLAPIVDKFPSVLEWNQQIILQILHDAEAFSHKNAIERRLKGVPDSFKVYLPEAKNGDHRTILDNGQQLLAIANILEDTSIRVTTYEQLYKKAKTLKRAVNLFEHTQQADVMMLANKMLRSIELAKAYGLDKIATFRELHTHVDTLLGDLALYKATLQTNRDKAARLDTKQLVDQINATVQHTLAKAAIGEIYTSVGRYLKGIDTPEAFVSRADEYARYIEKRGNDITKICEALELSPEEPDIRLEQMNGLTEAIDAASRHNIYADRFFMISPGQDVATWYDTVKNVRHFSNNHELDAYITHNTFVAGLMRAMPGNEPWLRSLLNEPNITFYDFVARVVNSVVRTTFNNLPSSQRKSITGTFFKEYARSLKTDRKAYYIDGLKKLLQETYAAARTISNNNNWVAAPSTMEKIRKNTKLITDTYPVVIATPKEVAKYIAPDKELFDYVIFDEASQLLPGQALSSIYRAKETVIVGDPHQMPPALTATIGGFGTDADLEDEEDISDSILDLAQKMQPEGRYHLKVHYRSESNKLFEPSRKAIYAQDNIIPIYEAHLYNAAPIDIVDNLGQGMDESGKYDKNFTEIVTRIRDYLAREPKASFCILFTTSIDANSFREYLVTYEDTLGEIAKLYAENKILISTVTNCQGIEGTFSILYMPHYDRPGAMWFFREGAGAYKRLNVAITRQRRGLTLLLADPRQHWLQACGVADNPNTTPNKKLSAELLRSLLQNAGEVVDTEYLDRTLADNAKTFDSPLTEQLYAKLCEHYKSRLNTDMKIYCEVGWHMLIPNTEGVKENNRNIGFRIDLGVYSMTQKRFILGIEMDGAAYHTGYDKEHSDYERQKVLEEKGWEIYRIWSTNWLNDQTSEFQRLVQKIDRSLGNAGLAR